MNIQFSPPDITELEIAEVCSAMRSGWITTGPKTKLFEQKIADYCGTSKVVCLNSATAALEMALRSLNIGPGDEVITSAYTYTASASVIAHIGAKMVLIDTMPGSFEIDYDKVGEAINPRTKIIIPVDIGGVPVDYDRLFNILEKAKAHFTATPGTLQEKFDRCIIVADSAHSFGARYHDKQCGAVADFTAFSFHAVKNLTTAEGGALTWRDRDNIDNEELYHKYMLLSLHGQSKDALSKMKLGSWEYDIVDTNYKCNMTDITAAMGLVQIARFNGLISKRRAISEIYDRILLPIGIERLEHNLPDRQGNYHLYLLRIPGIDEKKRNEIIIKMAEAGIACNVHFKPLPMHTAYKKLGFSIADYPNAYRQYSNEITLPLHTLLTEEEALYVAETMKAILTSRDQFSAHEDFAFKRVWDTDKESMEEICRLFGECGEQMFLEDGLMHWADPITVDYVRNECIDSNVWIVNDAKNGEAVAFYSYSLKPSPYFPLNKKALYINRIAVSPALWRKGIGTIIMDNLREICTVDEIECIQTTVYVESKKAVSFFLKCGFETIYDRPTKHFIVNCMEVEIKKP